MYPASVPRLLNILLRKPRGEVRKKFKKSGTHKGRASFARCPNLAAPLREGLIAYCGIGILSPDSMKYSDFKSPTKPRIAAIHFVLISWPDGSNWDSSSTNAVSFSSACTTKHFPSPRCASATKIVRPHESTVATQPQLQPALLRLFSD